MNNYTPDSIYMVCGHMNNSNSCEICSNSTTSNLFPGINIEGTRRGFAYCPFGKKDSMNQSIFVDQQSINNNTSTKWGRVPQLPPRSLSLIGLDWRTS